MQSGQPRSAPGGYRTDIDGLRAVAVLSVVAFHAHLPYVSGGYVGVDVFFVISGYLISAIIMRDIDRGRFSVADFYERRIRRIFPAMFAMFFAVTAVAAWLLLPREVITYAQSLLAALVSGSNFLFWHQSGYFDVSSTFKPLLHTWSLAVEEQFYILFPPFLILLKRWLPRHIKAAVFTLFFISLAASCVVVRHNTDAAFYFTPLRAWELLLGTILSQHYMPALRSEGARHTASIAGLLMILYPVFFYQDWTVFPGYGALLPCIGTGLIIAAGEHGKSVVGSMLSLKPVVFVGLISYSLYLWHWPVIVFQETNSLIVPAGYEGQHLTGPALILVSLVLAVLSWAFIERPFRFGKEFFTRKRIFAGSAVAMVLLSVAAWGMIASGGMPSRYPGNGAVVASYLYKDEVAGMDPQVTTCFIDPSRSIADFHDDVCLPTHPGKHSVLLMGDSHARALYPALAEAMQGSDVMLASASGCSPLKNEPVVVNGKYAIEMRNCRDVFQHLFEQWLPTHHVDDVVMVSRWKGTDFAELGITIAWLRAHGMRVLLVGPNAEYEAPLPRLMAEGIRSGYPDASFISMSQRAPSVDAYMEQQAQAPWSVPYLSYFRTFCKNGCPIYAEPNVPMEFDGDHLTLAANRKLAKVIQQQLAEPQR